MNNKFTTIAALSIALLYVDLFCGAGGTSTGVETAKVAGNKCAKVIACVNHDANAIASHAANHPEARHFTEDIRTLDVRSNSDLVLHVAKMRKQYPFAKLSLWGSFECTDHSKAKGGMSREADSRTLPEHLFRYIIALNPDSIQIENVEEFLIWGPLIPKVVHTIDTTYCPLTPLIKPIWVPDPERKAEFYNIWVDKVKNHGYSYDFRLLNSADFGALTSRKRLFIQFNKPGFPTVWPEPTHAKNPVSGLFESLEKWKPVREVLDLEDQGNSIFSRKKPLVDNTLKVIIKGLVKAIAENENTFMFKYYGNGDNYNSINVPAGTVTTKDRFAIIQLIFNQYKTGYISGIEDPAGAVTTNPKANLLTFILNPVYGGHTNRPFPTIFDREDKAPLHLLTAIMAEYGVIDIKMRMLKIPELKQIMGFPKDYVLIGTQADQKKFIGNAVEVTMARKICEASALKLFQDPLRYRKAA